MIHEKLGGEKGEALWTLEKVTTESGRYEEV